jgi:hypothetical protein
MGGSLTILSMQFCSGTSNTDEIRRTKLYFFHTVSEFVYERYLKDTKFQKKYYAVFFMHPKLQKKVP